MKSREGERDDYRGRVEDYREQALESQQNVQFVVDPVTQTAAFLLGQISTNSEPAVDDKDVDRKIDTAVDRQSHGKVRVDGVLVLKIIGIASLYVCGDPYSINLKGQHKLSRVARSASAPTIKQGNRVRFPRKVELFCLLINPRKYLPKTLAPLV